jgi:hypothetical protein
MRPQVNHPNQSHWDALKNERRRTQKSPDGDVYCGACWRTEREHGVFDLHHRHYDTFGNEALHDVVLLCRSCHDAITSRIRAERFALGDRSEDVLAVQEVATDRFRPTLRKVAVSHISQQAEQAPRYRPTPRQNTEF